MATLTLNDLPVTEELSRKAMTAVRGGMGYGYKFTPYSWGDIAIDKSKDFSFKADSSILQMQDVATNVGNNVAVLGGKANPHVNVTADQDADIHNHVRF